MLKKMSTILIFTIIISIMSAVTFATGEIDIISGIANDKNIKATDQFLVSITRPEGDEFTFKRSYVVCGVSERQDMRVRLFVEKDGRFIPLQTTDKESYWDIGSSGVFMKEVVLKDGENNIKVVAYRKSEVSNLKVRSNLQVNRFTITVLDTSIKDTIRNGILKISDMIRGIF